MQQGEEQETYAAPGPKQAGIVTILPAFAGFSSETGENCLAKSRLPPLNGLAPAQ
jgi:hypothetical protein